MSRVVVLLVMGALLLVAAHGEDRHADEVRARAGAVAITSTGR